jgi:hypothetical protein
MLEEFARCYQAKTGDNFNVKCRQIRYVLVVEHVVTTVLNLQTHPFIQVSCTYHQSGYTSSHFNIQQGRLL